MSDSASYESAVNDEAQPALLRVFMPGAFAGLGEPMRAAFTASHPEVELAFHRFIPSGLLAAEIQSGAAADVYVSANRRYMEELQQAGFVHDYEVLAGNRLCVIVHPDAGSEISGLEDLARPGVRVVTPQSETDPCGQYIVELFERAGLVEQMRAKEARGELMHSVGSGDLPAFLIDGRAQAGILYASEASALGTSVRTIDLPPAYSMQEEIAFTIGAVRRSGVQHPRAGDLIAFMRGPAGQELLTGHGFLSARAVAAGRWS